MTKTNEASSTHRKLMKATAVMASGTLVSRIFGFVRVVMIAFVLGNGTRQADTFSIAMTVPNSLFMLFAGGALNTVLVPQIVRAIRHDDDGGQKFVSRLMTAFLLVLAVITVVITLLTPLIMSIYTNSGWRSEAMAEHWASLVLLAYLTMPQIFFYGMFFLIGQVLNARERFGPMMWAPVMNNVISIGVFGIYLGVWGTSGGRSEPFTLAQTLFLGISATFGILAQTLILVPYLHRIGFKYRPRFDFRNSGLGHTFQLAKWTLAYVAVNQLALVVVDRLATQATVGGQGAGVTAYLNAYLVWIMPHSLITVSLATAMLPTASRLAAADDMAGVGAETMRTMRLSSTFLLPAALGYIALGLPFARIAFGHGSGAADANHVGWTLMAFAIGLVPFTLQYVCLRAFYALEDTKTTFLVQCVIAATNAGLAFVVISVYNDPTSVAPRLALAFSVAYTVGMLLSFRILANRLPGLRTGQLIRHLVRLFVAAVPAALAGWGVDWLFTLWSDRLLVQVLSLLVAIVVAVVVFLVLARRLRIEEVQQTLAMLRRRGGGGGEAEVPPAGEEAPETVPEPELSPAAGQASAPQRAKADAPIATYPDADDGHEPSIHLEPTDEPVANVTAGQVLGDRYRLDEALARRAGVLTWRAFDLTLSRPVLMHLLPPNDPRTDSILAAARASAAVTDARFLRVLDAYHVDSEDYGSYIVCEYVSGHSLRKVLADGPLSSLEAAWAVREIAEAFTWVHTQKQYHRQLTPDTVIITNSGNVKIVGFLIEDKLSGPAPERTNGESVDIHAMGQLLYASLVSLWPGGDAYDLPAAPVRDGRILPPRQVVPGIPAALDQICDDLLNEPSQGSGMALSLMLTLTKILGTADASGDLERRVRNPVTPMFQASARGPGSASPAPVAPARTAPPPPVVVPAPAPRPDDDAPTATYSPFEDTDMFYTPVPPPARDPDDTRIRPAVPASAATGVPAPPAGFQPHARPPVGLEPRRNWLIALTAVVALALIGGLAVVAISQLGDRPVTTQTSTAPQTQQTSYSLQRALDFDPRADGGSGDENPGQAALAIDKNPRTQWRTEQYRGNPRLGGLKPGVGLIVDLGEPREVGRLTVTLSGTGTTLEIRVPIEATTGDTPPTRSQTQWRVVATKSGAQGATRLPLAKAETTRYLLVYLTSLPPDGGGYRAGVFEIEVGR